MRRALVVGVEAVVAVLLLTSCTGGDDGARADPLLTPSPVPTPSASPPPTAQEKFAREVEELYALVKESVEGSSDHASSAEVLAAFATTVALVRVEPEQEDDRQRVVDAAEAAAQAYRTVVGITGSHERTAAARHAVVRLRELERVIRTLPTEPPAGPPAGTAVALPS